MDRKEKLAHRRASRRMESQATVPLRVRWTAYYVHSNPNGDEIVIAPKASARITLRDETKELDITSNRQLAEGARQGAEAKPTRAQKVRRAIPVGEDESADTDLDQAWAALTSEQRAALRQEELNWIRYNNSLPIEERNKNTRERAKYIWSLVH
jgi:hypothetical protein